MIDRVAADEAEAFALAAGFLVLLPPNAWTAPEVRDSTASPSTTRRWSALVPGVAAAPYDMRLVLQRLTDDGTVLRAAAPASVGD